jgi:hypothetical protein
MSRTRRHCTCGECLACTLAARNTSALAPLIPGPLVSGGSCTPGPGSYTPDQPLRHGTKHRPHSAASDGPQPLAPGESSMREREMAAALLNGAAPLGPGPGVGRAAEGKDALLRRPPSTKIGTGRRFPAPPAYALSLSRSLQLRAAAVVAAAEAPSCDHQQLGDDGVPSSAAAHGGSAEADPPPSSAAGQRHARLTQAAGACHQSIQHHQPQPAEQSTAAGHGTAANSKKPKASDAPPVPWRLKRELQHFSRRPVVDQPADGGGDRKSSSGPPLENAGTRAAAVAAKLAERRRLWAWCSQQLPRLT